jgi:predicted solute-binding protein
VAIGSDGPVASVFLAHRDPLEAIRVVHLDPASLTSANLLRLLLAERGLRPEFRPLAGYGREDMPDNVLLIGNPAITFALGPHDHRILDLGEAWLAMTGLPFVYAAWTVRETAATAGLAEELRAAAAAGVAAIPRLVETAPDFTPAFRRAYLGGHIRYGLGEREKAGLERFRNLLERHVGLPTRPAVFF